jgi:MarR family transcriptional regulator, organic hydroperoxide resistance regulator
MSKLSKEACEASELMFELLMAQKRSMHVAAKELGLSPQQAATIWNLAPGEGLAMNALAELLMCDASNVTGIVDKLETRGLVRRGQAEDRRVKVLVLTEQGENMREILRDRLLAPPEWIASLTRAAQRELRDLLRGALEGARAPAAES